MPLDRYEAAVRANPIRPGEDPSAYAARIAGIVAGTEPGEVKDMPTVRLPYAERDE